MPPPASASRVSRRGSRRAVPLPKLEFGEVAASAPASPADGDENGPRQGGDGSWFRRTPRERRRRHERRRATTPRRRRRQKAAVPLPADSPASAAAAEAGEAAEGPQRKRHARSPAPSESPAKRQRLGASLAEGTAAVSRALSTARRALAAARTLAWWIRAGPGAVGLHLAAALHTAHSVLRWLRGVSRPAARAALAVAARVWRLAVALARAGAASARRRGPRRTAVFVASAAAAAAAAAAAHPAARATVGAWVAIGARALGADGPGEIGAGLGVAAARSARSAGTALVTAAARAALAWSEDERPACDADGAAPAAPSLCDAACQTEPEGPCGAAAAAERPQPARVLAIDRLRRMRKAR